MSNRPGSAIGADYPRGRGDRVEALAAGPMPRRSIRWQGTWSQGQIVLSRGSLVTRSRGRIMAETRRGSHLPAVQDDNI